MTTFPMARRGKRSNVRTVDFPCDIGDCFVEHLERPLSSSTSDCFGSRYASCMKCTPGAIAAHDRGARCGHERSFASLGERLLMSGVPPFGEGTSEDDSWGEPVQFASAVRGASDVDMQTFN